MNARGRGAFALRVVGRGWWLAAFATACATLADGGPGIDNPPTAKAGPFRLIESTELGQSRAAPFVMDDQGHRLRDPSVAIVDRSKDELVVEGYFSSSDDGASAADDAQPTSIVRMKAIDGRSFDRSPETVLTPSHDWEGDTVGAPSVLIEGSSRRLYYAGADGIGLAKSTDGGSFESLDAPVLSEDHVPWAESAPRSPGAVKLADGTFRLFFEAKRGGVVVLGEAKSDDGATWEVFDEPALGPSGGDGVDGVSIGSPSAVTATSEEGRRILYVYFGATAKTGKSAISFAARYLDDPDSPLVRSNRSVYAGSGFVVPREPCVVRFEAFTVLFTTQKRTKSNDDAVVTAGVSPTFVELPAPSPL